MAKTVNLLERYECGPFRFADDDYYDRHLVFDHVVALEKANTRQRFEAMASAIRDLLTQRWLLTGQTHDRQNPKQVYYLSMEFLIGRTLANNIANLQVEEFVRNDFASDAGHDWQALFEQEPDAGLGNGGLGRLAACFIDSLATLQIPAIGYGLRYEYGMFRQEIDDGRQVEHPDNWLIHPDPWEVVRPSQTVDARLDCAFQMREGRLTVVPNVPTILRGIPYDRPVVGYGGRTINALRLWGAAAHDDFNFLEFSRGDFFDAVHEKVAAEVVTRVLYPDDSTPRGRNLRFVQEYFLVACSLADIVARFRRRGNDWKALPDKVAIQLNDTHPAMSVAELMRILLDDAKLGWDEAWDITRRTLAYTNHTLLPEALETWPISLFETMVPRLLDIIYEINRRFLDDVRARFPDDPGRLSRISLIAEGPEKRVRMANLAIVGTHSTNGVAEIHSRLLRTTVVSDLATIFPERFNNKTNGVTPRRWLLLANPDLSRLISGAIGDGWVSDLSQLKKIVPLADDASFRGGFRQAKRAAKTRFADWLKTTTGLAVDPDTIFDSQVKRIHEYKRQLLNALHIIILYNRFRDNPKLDEPPRTFFFAGKAAPAYTLAKLIIKLINNVASVVNVDPVVGDKLKVFFLPEYNVSLAQRLIPASDVSEQISTAGFEASGTGNMKFMMNGALTIGTRDGAVIEMAAEAGEENFFLFGLSADQVAASQGWYNPRWHYEHEPETSRALDMIAANAFSPYEPGIFGPICDTLLPRGDHYMHLADLASYVRAQEQVGSLYVKPDEWTRRAIKNVGHSGKFSSDRTISQYASEIWNAKPCPVE
ncbi:MAG TPA: glycogen/starch/alpha-glucan phosphorylase [Isosphaeraceae bacterium]|nr:glycogen/starch/alpha-glucan phosphorylase [Isosphaeraceae bacterium]